MRAVLFLGCLGLCGCVSTTLTTPEGLVIERKAFYSDVTIRAMRSPEGAVAVEETQDGGDVGRRLLEILNQATTRSP